MNQIKPTRADKRHFGELQDAINDAYVDGKPLTRAVELITLRRWQVESTYDTKLHRLKQRVKELEEIALKAIETL